MWLCSQCHKRIHTAFQLMRLKHQNVETFIHTSCWPAYRFKMERRWDMPVDQIILFGRVVESIGRTVRA